MHGTAVIKNLDHLGLVATMIDELDIENSIDSEIPFDTNKKGLSYGMLVKAMILNGLGYVNKQLYLTPRFFKDKPLETLFGTPIICAEQINDDALGRTLDTIYDYGVSELWVQIKICTKTDTDSLSRLNSSFSLALNHSSSSSYINLLL